MLRRSLSAVLARPTLTITVAGRVVQRSLPPTVSQCARSLHLSTHKFSDNDSRRHKNRTDSGNKYGEQKNKLNPVSAVLKKAAVNAAKSLPGNWTRTAEELVSQLQLQQSRATESEAAEPEGNDKSLLNSMEIGRSFQSRHQKGQFHDPSSSRTKNVLKGNMNFGDSVRDEIVSSTRINKLARNVEDYKNLFSVPRLGIFDAEKLKSEGDKQLVSKEPDDLWARVDAENRYKALGAVPRNAFEEMIKWTKEGKLWKFPIDNEADMDEEKKYKFHDHVFLERHLSEFPDKGPIRKFMELVTLGLSMNPWITVPEKIEHIQWFADYFRQKQDILETSIGEQGKMKNSNKQLE